MSDENNDGPFDNLSDSAIEAIEGEARASWEYQEWVTRTFFAEVDDGNESVMCESLFWEIPRLISTGDGPIAEQSYSVAKSFLCDFIAWRTDDRFSSDEHASSVIDALVVRSKELITHDGFDGFFLGMFFFSLFNALRSLANGDKLWFWSNLGNAQRAAGYCRGFFEAWIASKDKVQKDRTERLSDGRHAGNRENDARLREWISRNPFSPKMSKNELARRAAEALRLNYKTVRNKLSDVPKQ